MRKIHDCGCRRRGAGASDAGRIIRLMACLGAILTVCAGGAGGQIFEKVTSSPVAATGGNSWGTSWVDYDMDGDLDLFVVANSNTIFRGCLFRNDGGAFTEITSDPIGTDPYLEGAGCSWGDYDGDGDPDLLVATWDRNYNLLYRNDGAGVFTKITTHALNGDPWYSISPSWIDYDLDGRLDLFVANHSSGIGAGDGQNWLYRNTESGFVRITGNALTQESAGSNCGVWGDIDNDGDCDLFVANAWDNPGGRLYRNDGGGSFTLLANSPATFAAAYSFGGSWGDYDNDGDLDLFVTCSPANRLYNNDGAGRLSLVTGQQISADVSHSTGATWADFDNDGDLDLYVVNGSDDQRRVNYLYINNGAGVFSRHAGEAAVTDLAASNGVSSGDYDGDGSIDVYVSNGYASNENNNLYRNRGGSNHWLIVRCRGAGSNRMAIGAKVRVKASIGGRDVWQLREIQSQTGHNGQNAPEAHFGLGDAAVADTVRIEWPLGPPTVLAGVEADRRVVAEQDTATVATFLRSFNVEETGGLVILRWSVTGRAAPEEFRLAAGAPGDDAAIFLDVTGAGPSAFTAVDRPEERSAKGTIQYNLYNLDGTGEWSLVHRENHDYQAQPGRAGITAIAPNPFNPATSISFRVGECPVARLDIFDCAGRLVRTLGDRTYPRGGHCVFWDGKDDKGRPAASGVYYARLVSGKERDSRKLILLK